MATQNILIDVIYVRSLDDRDVEVGLTAVVPNRGHKRRGEAPTKTAMQRLVFSRYGLVHVSGYGAAGAKKIRDAVEAYHATWQTMPPYARAVAMLRQQREEMGRAESRTADAVAAYTRDDPFAVRAAVDEECAAHDRWVAMRKVLATVLDVSPEDLYRASKVDEEN